MKCDNYSSEKCRKIETNKGISLKGFMIILISFFVVVTNTLVFADSKHTAKYNLEVGGFYEYLSPNNIYGSWKNLFLRFYYKPKINLTWLVESTAFERDKEGDAFLGVLGVYKDWAPWIYTYSSFSAGTSSSYLPKVRIDHEFNIKLTKKKNIIPSIGVTYINYHDVHKHYIVYPGITYYGTGFVLTYKHFINISQPGKISSHSELVSMGIGREEKSWTYLDISYGNQAYLATYLLNPEEVRQNSFYVSLKRIQWIRKTFGTFLEINYFKLSEGYKKYGISGGIFKKF